jgi:hypothetical protein
MYKIRLFLVAVYCIPTILLAQYGANDDYLYNMTNTYDYLPIYSAQNAFITDLVLIYQGGVARLPYTVDQIRPYVYRDNNQGGVDWLFDGFLFLESRSFDGYAFEQYGYRHEANRARKKEWEWLLNRVFEPGKAVSALNNVLDSLSKKGKTPVRKRKVIISLPEPLDGQKDWGEIAGKKLDFSLDADKIIAVKWYVDQLIKRFEEGEFAHLELAGFYWIREDDELGFRIVPSVSNYVNSKGKTLNWIPNWGPHRGENWKQHGFNAAYIQPNLFMTGAFENIEKASKYASLHNMGLEMEFDYRISQAAYQNRFNAYLTGFEREKVFEKAAIAYYEGGRQFYTLSKETNPTLVEIFKKLTDIINERQKRADQLYLNK